MRGRAWEGVMRLRVVPMRVVPMRVVLVRLVPVRVEPRTRPLRRLSEVHHMCLAVALCVPSGA